MGPSCCPRPPPLLVLALCWMLAPLALGMPVQTSSAVSGAPPRGDLQESASGDDLISGSDFLSVFIGAALPPGARHPGRARSLPGAGAPPPPGSKTAPSADEDNKLGAYGARLIPKPKPKAVKNSPAHSRVQTHTPTPPTAAPPPIAHGLAKTAAITESLPLYQDLSHSKTPSPEALSFDPSNIDSNPLPEASAKILHRIEPPKLEVGTESLLIRSKIDGTRRLTVPEIQVPKEEVTTNSESIVTTGRDNLVDLIESDVDQETQGYKSELTIITEVVTSREEITPTEPTIVVSKESFQNDAQSYSNYERDINDPDPKEHPDKTPPDDHLNSVAATVPTSEEVTAAVQESDSANTAAPPFPPAPPSVQQVVSVRVSSSVVQGPSPAPHDSRGKHDGLAHTPAAPASEEEMQHQIEAESANGIISEPAPTPAIETLEPPQPALVTEERPTNIAVQRSEFSVEESGPSSSELSPRRVEQPSVFHKTVARVVEVSRNSQAAPVSYHTSVSSATSGSRVQFYSEPPSYHRDLPSNVAESIRTSVVTSHQHTGGNTRPKYEHISGISMSSDPKDEAIESRMGRYGTPHHEVRISGANVRFSSEVRSSQEKPRDPSLRDQKSFRNSERPEQNFEVPERNYAKPENVYVQPVQNYAQPERNYAQPERNYAQTERNYAHPERTYSLPEQNYEVDEAVSVMSNGRVHGVQATTPASVPLPQVRVPPASPPPPPPPASRPPLESAPTGPAVERAIGLDTSQGRDPNHKFGYVVEGRNFRKYRVEERTPDGFIVGEYGVVSHDDGSLRGVRYTADGTTNPQLIYEALIKFLSL